MKCFVDVLKILVSHVLRAFSKRTVATKIKQTISENDKEIAAEKLKMAISKINTMEVIMMMADNEN